MAASETRGEQQTQPVASRFSDRDIYLFKEGSHSQLHDKLGSHPGQQDGVDGTQFAVWAPNAARVSVIGDFNDWEADRHSLRGRDDGSGIWEGFVPGVAHGMAYKYRIVSRYRDYQADKGDPLALAWECPPRTASRVWRLDYEWGDAAWMAGRRDANALAAPLSIYEVHLGSWRRVPEDGNRFLSYRELAEQLPPYVQQLGFTHVELMPVAEHPFYGSWGYQGTGYFAPTARYGTPEDFMFLVDSLHRHGIGVIIDWVPSHFPDDAHGLAYFDGTQLYEHADPKLGYHPEWKSYIFNYGRHEVRAFLMSSALFWLDTYHADGLRVDGVASMLYLDYGRREGEWIPNRHGGKENLDAIDFLRHVNEAVYRDHPDTQTMAEESTAWPMVSRPTYVGGLGFGMKWNMGWMHDTLQYFASDPLYRSYCHERITFSLWYAFNENFVLPLSHDEVVHGKGSLIGKMPGDEWQQFANLRLLYGYQWTHPGKKLLFMGGEFGQRREWQHDESLEWHVLQYPLHRGLQRWVEDLNRFYRAQRALYEDDFTAAGFEWVDSGDRANSVLSYLRQGRDADDILLVVCNCTPLPRTNYAVGVPRGGRWEECLNSDAPLYGGSGQGNLGGVDAAPVPWHGRFHSLRLTLPPLAVLVFKPAEVAT
ncbi:1,4-alpha-glucan branching protein GlgB [Dechloromonas sp. A34]|uniref:1,4-alpha-glucan branching protein GlgB n=1 Tax=Dechloromonas sp. A34 TaxID=447588 RepID=UPI002248C35E|nr:1,4-alpha-glucan branching protein GlgB [Dechloromonas sp. A34]